MSVCGPIAFLKSFRYASKRNRELVYILSKSSQNFCKKKFQWENSKYVFHCGCWLCSCHSGVGDWGKSAWTSDFMEKYAETENMMGGLVLLDNHSRCFKALTSKIIKSPTLHYSTIIIIASTGLRGQDLSGWLHVLCPDWEYVQIELILSNQSSPCQSSVMALYQTSLLAPWYSFISGSDHETRYS